MQCNLLTTLQTIRIHKNFQFPTVFQGIDWLRRQASLILTGGGQPNLWPHFESFVKYAHSQGIEWV